MSPSANELLTTQLAELISGVTLEPALANQLPSAVLQTTQSWAAGMWKVEARTLRQLFFAKDPAFDPQVAAEFQQATVQVSLEQTQLGIVNAIVHRRPALAISTEQTGDLQKSASWLERFGARCSLSCPIQDSSGQIVAVLAVSWRDLISLEDPLAQSLLQLTGEIGQKLPA